MAQLLPSEMAIDRPPTISHDMRAKSAILHPDATLHLELQASNLTNVATGLLRNRISSPAFRVCYWTGTEFAPVVTSAPIPFDLNPRWEVLTARCAPLCRCDMERPIQIQVLDQGQQPDAVPMGHCDTTVRELLKRHMAPFPFELVQEGKSVGTIGVVSAMIEIESKQGMANERELPRQRSASALPANNEAEEPEEPGLFGAALGKWRKRMSLGNINDNDTEEEQPEKPALTPIKQEQRKKQHPTKEQPQQQLVEAKRNKKGIPPNQEQKKPQPKQEQQFLHLQLRGWDLEEVPGRRLLGEEQPVAASRSVSIGKFQPGMQHDKSPFQTIRMTKVVPHDQNPLWEEMTVPLEELCGGDLDVPILLSALEEGLTVMGWCQTTVRELLKSAKKGGFMSIQDNRKRHFGEIAVVSAAIDVSGGEEISQQEDPQKVPEEEAAVPNWLARTLNLAAGLMQSVNSQDEDDGKPSDAQECSQSNARQDEHGDDKENNVKEVNNDTDTLKMETIAKILREAEAAEEREESESEDDDDQSTGSTDSDVITIADVLSVAEESILRSSPHREGLLELTALLRPKKQVPKDSAQAILAGMPGWTLDGDSVAGSPKAKTQQQRQAQQKKTQPLQGALAADLSVHSVYIDEARSIAEEKTTKTEAKKFDVNAYLDNFKEMRREEDRVVHERRLNDDLKDDSVATGEDDELLRRQVALSMEASLGTRRGAKKNASKKAKKRVQKTLKTIYGILKENLKSIPETAAPLEGPDAAREATKGKKAGLSSRERGSSMERPRRSKSTSASAKEGLCRSRSTSPSRRRSRIRACKKVPSKEGEKPQPQGVHSVEAYVSKVRESAARSKSPTTRRPKKSISHDGDLFKQARKQRAGNKRVPRRTMSNDTAKIGGKRNEQQSKKAKPPRRNKSFGDGLASCELLGLQLTKQLAKDEEDKPEPTNLPKEPRRPRKTGTLHESLPCPMPQKEKRTPRRRSSLSDGFNVVKDGAKKFSGVMLASAKGVENGARRAGGAVAASAKGVVGGRHHEVEEQETFHQSMELEQLGNSHDAFDCGWASFPSESFPVPSFPPAPDQPNDKSISKKKSKKPGRSLSDPPEKANKKSNSKKSTKPKRNHSAGAKGAGKITLRNMIEDTQTPAEYLISQGLSEAEANAVVEASGVSTIQDFALFEEEAVLSEVAEKAGLKIIPAKKLSNAINSYCEEGSKSSKSTGVLGAAAKVMSGTAKVVGKGVVLAGTGAFSATKTMAEGAVRVGKGTVEVVSKTPEKVNGKSGNDKLKASSLAWQMDDDQNDNLPALHISVSIVDLFVADELNTS